MRCVLFYHSILSDWNHGNAHFLRGYARELAALGHDVIVYEPSDGWSRSQLVAGHGQPALDAARALIGDVIVRDYDLATLDLNAALDGAHVVIVHEWTPPELVARVGAWRREHPRARLLFHDTHHRAVSAPHEISDYDLSAYDGVLAFGRVLRNLYLARAWARRVWVWHEAADTTIFRPYPHTPCAGDLVWIGNWGDDERVDELREFLIEPARELGLTGTIHGVRWPADALALLTNTRLHYGNWLPNHAVPRIFAAHRFTVHVPRRPYAALLPGIPTIRPFEALACGIPLISAPWDDTEGLFTPGHDYLVARDGASMRDQMRTLLNEPELARALARHGRRTIHARHTCALRVAELLRIFAELEVNTASPSAWDRILPGRTRQPATQSE